MTFQLTILSHSLVVARRSITTASGDLTAAVTQTTAALVEQYGTLTVKVMRQGWERPAVLTVGKPGKDPHA